MRLNIIILLYQKSPECDIVVYPRNPDTRNPDIRNPDIRNPEYHCRDSGENTRNPDIRNPDYQLLTLHYPASMLVF